MKGFRPLKLLRCYACEFSRSGSFLATLSRDVVVWDMATCKKRFRTHPLSHPSHCAVHPSEAEMAVKNTSAEIVVLDTEKGEIIRVLDLGGVEGSNICYSACGEFLVDGSWSGVLTVRSSTTGAIEFKRHFPGEMITKVVRDDHSGRWFTVHSPVSTRADQPAAPDHVCVWGWPMTTPLRTIRLRHANIDDLSIAPDGSTCAVSDRDVISLFDVDGLSVVASLSGVAGVLPRTLAWSPDSRMLAAVVGEGVAFYSIPGLERIHEVPLKFACDVQFSPDGSKVACGSWSGGLLVEAPNLIAARVGERSD